MAKHFNDDAIERVQSSVKWTESKRTPTGGPPIDPSKRHRIRLAKITAQGTTAGYYKATEQIWDNATSAFINNPNGLTWDGTAGNQPELYELNGDAEASIDAIVQAFTIGDNAGNTIWVFNAYAAEPFFLVKLGGATAIPNYSNRWKYSYTQVVPEREGRYKVPDGAGTGDCYNMVEANNSATGVQGNGIDVDNLPAGYNLGPIGAGAVVVAYLVINCDGNPEIHFEGYNPVVGTC